MLVDGCRQIDGGGVCAVGDLDASGCERLVELVDALVEGGLAVAVAAAEPVALLTDVGEQAVEVGGVGGGALEQLGVAGATGVAWDRGEDLLATVADLDELGGGELAEVGVDLADVDRELLGALDAERALQLVVEGLVLEAGSCGRSRSVSWPTLM